MSPTPAHESSLMPRPGTARGSGHSVARGRLVVALCALVLLFGLVTMLGWATGYRSLVQWWPGQAPVTFNTALCFVAASVALLGIALGSGSGLGLLRHVRHRIAAVVAARVLAAFVIGFASLLLAQYVFDVSLGLDQLITPFVQDRLAFAGRMAPATAFAFMLLGTAIIALSLTYRDPWLCSWARPLSCMAALLAVGTLAGQVLLGPQPDAGISSGAVQLSAIAPQTTLFMVVLSGAVWAACVPLRTRLSWLMDHGAAWLCAGLACAVFVAWVGFKREEWRGRQADVALAHSALLQAVSARVEERAGILRRLAEYHPDTLPGQAEWEHAAGLIVRDFPSFVAVALVAPDMKIRARVSRDGRTDLVGSSLNVDAGRMQAYRLARQTGLPQLTAPIELRSGGYGVAWVVAAPTREHFQAYVSASIRADELQALLEGNLQRDFAMALRDGDQVITRTGPQPGQLAAALRQSAQLPMMGRIWTVDLWPRDSYLRSASSRLPGIVLVGGLLVVALIAAAFVQARRGMVSARRLASTLENITDGFLTIDPQWRFTYLNPVAERLLQTTREQVVGRGFAEAFPQAVGSNFQLQYEHAVATGQTVAFEDFYPPLDKWFAVRAYPSADGLALYFQDISDARAQRIALQRSEERFRLLARAAHDVVWDWDLSSPSRQWSDAFATLLRGEGGPLPGCSDAPDMQEWAARIHPEDRERVTTTFQAFAESIDLVLTWEQEYRFSRSDGSVAWVHDRAYAISRGPGSVGAQMVGVMSDVTEKHALRQQLAQSQRLESVGQLTGGVAHDFNNLLTVIMGNAELLADQLAHMPRSQLLASLIVTAAQRGADLTQRLLAFARKQALTPRVVQVDLLVADMESLLRRTLGEHVRINLRSDPDLWRALVDPVQLESSVLNLTLNARDAMPDGGELVIETCNTVIDAEYASLHPDVKAGEYVLLAVSDTGVGIPAANMARLFEPFFTTKELGKGTGLGLPMVYGFVKQSGGHVSVYSEVGVGTTVKLYLPCAPQGPGAPAPDDDPAARQPAVPRGGHETVLVVEDDALVRAHASQLLQGLGYRVLQAQDGAHALALLREGQRVHLLFTDVVMPGMSGRQLADAVRAMLPDLPVLFTSGYTDNAIVHHGRLDPGVRLLTKPYRRAELAQAVRAALDDTEWSAGSIGSADIDRGLE